MIDRLGPVVRIHDRWNRREILRVGGFGLLAAGSSVPGSARGASTPDETRATGTTPPGRAKSCIILFLMGGPSQYSTWDPKPDAPAEVRGEFGPIATNVPGLSLSELLPRTASVAHTLCVLRAMTTGDFAHSSSGYYMLTGRPHLPLNTENATPGSPNDFPSLGTLIGQFGPGRGALPPSVTLPGRIANSGGFVWPGQDAGFLGRSRDPWLLNARLTPDGYRIDEITLPDDLDVGRLDDREGLSDRLQSGLDVLGRNPTARVLDDRRRQAFDLLRSPQARRAFRLDLESEATRERFGKTRFGQGVLLSRRLVEAGVRLVQVNWPNKPNWDTHFKESAHLKDELVPPMDQAYSALLEDLERRGLLEETLVVCMAEFGRGPRIEVGGGRGHWGSAFSIVLAGGGVRGGQVYGASDRIGAYPREGMVRPEDLSATLIHCLGLDPRTEFHDPQGRPYTVGRGEVLHSIL